MSSVKTRSKRQASQLQETVTDPVTSPVQGVNKNKRSIKRKQVLKDGKATEENTNTNNAEDIVGIGMSIGGTKQV